MEELGIEYNLELHKRIKGRAPPELKDTHPLGKSPQLILGDGRVLIETSTILQYLISTYDKDARFQGDGQKNDSLRDQELSDFVGQSVGGNVMIGVIFGALVHATPFFVRPLMNGIWKGLRSAYFDAEIDLNLGYLNTQLTDQDYLMGPSPGRPDFLLSFVIDNLEQRQLIKEPQKYPLVQAWNTRCKARPAWQRSIEKGNGYDFSSYDF